MKQISVIIFTILLLFNSALSAQNIEKMNKSELKEFIVILTTKIDSLRNKNIDLLKSINKISENSSLIDQKNILHEIEISQLKELIQKNEIESKRIISENKFAVSKLNESIRTLKDSISRVQSYSNVVSTSTTYNSNDFLNNYFFNQVPLPNNSFSLILSKLVYGDKSRGENDRNYEYDYDNYQGTVERLPEILDAKAFTYWSVKPNVKITSETNLSNYVISKNSDYFDSQLPKIEVLKNKLFTIKYNDGAEESFLFNVKKIESKDNNNQRKILQIELANEEVKEDGSNNTAKDIVWRFFAIENECYLALTLGQLNRLKLNLVSWDKGIEAYLPNSQSDNFFVTDYNSYYKYMTSGKGIYLSRNKDLFMNSGEYIDPKEIIYLFKLK